MKKEAVKDKLEEEQQHRYALDEKGWEWGLERQNVLSSFSASHHLPLLLLEWSDGRGRAMCVCRELSVHSSIHTTILYSNSVCPEAWYVKSSMLKIPGCPATSSFILLCGSQHASLGILTHNHVHSGR